MTEAGGPPVGVGAHVDQRLLGAGAVDVDATATEGVRRTVRLAFTGPFELGVAGTVEAQEAGLGEQRAGATGQDLAAVAQRERAARAVARPRDQLLQPVAL